jgi:restriction endonuclease Mrr
LEFAADGLEHHIREAVEALAIGFGLTDLERSETTASGQKLKFADRVQWEILISKRQVYLKVLVGKLSTLHNAALMCCKRALLRLGLPRFSGGMKCHE